MEFSVSLEGLDRLASKSRLVAKIAAEEASKGLFASGLLVEKTAKESIASGPKSGRTYEKYNPRRTHRASAPGEAPATDEGTLVNSIHTREVAGELAVEVAASAKHAKPLELGTRLMAARPFLFPALERSKAAIRRRMERALDRTIARAAKKGVESLKE